MPALPPLAPSFSLHFQRLARHLNGPPSPTVTTDSPRVEAPAPSSQVAPSSVVSATTSPIGKFSDSIWSRQTEWFLFFKNNLSEITSNRKDPELFDDELLRTAGAPEGLYRLSPTVLAYHTTSKKWQILLELNPHDWQYLPFVPTRTLYFSFDYS